TGDFKWATRICEFAVSGGEPTPADTEPAAPSDLVATAASSSQIDLSWTDNAGNEDGTEIERSDDNLTFVLIATVGPNVTGYSDAGLPASATRYYRVRAFNSVGFSAYSNTASATTLEEGVAESVHVESIVTGTENLNRGNKRGFADVTIHDNLGQPVGDATVSGTFSGSFNESGTGVTGADGTVRIKTTATARGGVTVNFCVNTVTASLPYNAADNSSASYDCGSVSKAGLAAETPDGFALAQNFPNPFNPVTAINFSLPEGSHVVLKVYRVLGEEVATLVDGFADEGSHTVRFDASGLSTGLYIYTIRAGSYAASRRMSLLK
ncbi:MAG TPA: T9SS type A sorting domain-containing protein, partial [Rhodothermales bacterium]|nr:T9SS type A sorting domain-containing protein [Rhodothermales bacterium]